MNDAAYMHIYWLAMYAQCLIPTYYIIVHSNDAQRS